MAKKEIKRRGATTNRMDFTEKPKNIKKSFKRLMSYVREYRPHMIVAIIAAVGATVFSIVGPKIMGEVTTEIFKGLLSKIQGGTGIDFSGILRLLTTLGGIYVLSFLLSFLQGVILRRTALKISYKLRNQMSQKINRLPLSYFDQHSYGDTIARMTSDNAKISEGFSLGLTNAISSTMTVLGIIIMMFSISWQMTLVALLTLPLILLVTIGIAKKSQPLFAKQRKDLGNVNGDIEENFSGHIEIKTFQKEDEKFEDFSKINDELFESTWKSQFVSGLMMPMVQFIGNLGYAIISIAGVIFTIQGTLQVGYILSFLQYMRNFTQPFSQMAQATSTIQSALAASERVFEFLDEEEIVEIAKDELQHVKGGVCFDHVSFGYDQNMVIEDLSVDIHPGSHVAIVGPTGSGKTTLIKLLLGLYEPNSGSIYVDGQDTQKVTKSSLRDQIGIVLQDTWLMSETIRENIQFGSDSTFDEVVERAKMANADFFIRTLPGNYDMVVDDDANNISQGQKQLLTIARALMKPSKIMILDEATSSVDTMTEKHIVDAMEQLMKGKTSFVIAHRLSTIKNADLILVIDQGKLVEQGNHEQLMEKKGFYYSLYAQA